MERWSGVMADMQFANCRSNNAPAARNTNSLFPAILFRLYECQARQSRIRCEAVRQARGRFHYFAGNSLGQSCAVSLASHPEDREGSELFDGRRVPERPLA